MSLFKKKPAASPVPPAEPVPNTAEAIHAAATVVASSSMAQPGTGGGAARLGVASHHVEENKAKYRLTDFELLETLGTAGLRDERTPMDF